MGRGGNGSPALPILYLERLFDGAWESLRVAYDEPSMVKADLIDRALDATDLERSAIRDAVDALFESVGSALERGDRVVLRRFGVFYPAPRKTGVARNPHTGEPAAIPRGRVVRFRSAPGLQSFPEGN